MSNKYNKITAPNFEKIRKDKEIKRVLAFNSVKKELLKLLEIHNERIESYNNNFLPIVNNPKSMIFNENILKVLRA